MTRSRRSSRYLSTELTSTCEGPTSAPRNSLPGVDRVGIHELWVTGTPTGWRWQLYANDGTRAPWDHIAEGTNPTEAIEQCWCDGHAELDKILEGQNR